MAVMPVSQDAAGVQTYHQERDHGGVLPWAAVRFGTILVDGRAADDRAALVLACPVAGCGSETTHPGGDTAPAAVLAALAELRARIPAGPRPATQAETDDATTRDLVVAAAQTAVGINVTALTAGQVRALAAILLWKAGALNPDGTVRALATWAK